MSKSERVRLGDLRRAYRLIHDCRDVGHDPSAWPAILAEGAARLVNAQIVVVGEIRLSADGPVPEVSVLADRGWQCPAHRSRWHRRYHDDNGYLESPTFQRFAAIRGDLVTRGREQLVGDDEWYRSAEFNEEHRPIEIDDMVASFSRSGDPPTLIGLNLNRPLGHVRFTTGERRLVRMMHHELNRHIGRSLVREPGGPFRELPPRLHRTLLCLLDGDGEKQVALRMGLSRHTVHEYVTTLYRRLGVQSRAELMAMCRRHRFPPG